MTGLEEPTIEATQPTARHSVDQAIDHGTSPPSTAGTEHTRAPAKKISLNIEVVLVLEDGVDRRPKRAWIAAGISERYRNQEETTPPSASQNGGVVTAPIAIAAAVGEPSITGGFVVDVDHALNTRRSASGRWCR